MANGVTICPYCGCGCGFHLQSENNELTGIIPNSNHPVSRGSLCIKGWKAYEFPNHPDRLDSPLIRKNGRLEKATWEEALSLVATKLMKIKDNYGSNSLGICSSAKTFNEENYLLQKFARSVLLTNNIDHCARL